MTGHITVDRMGEAGDGIALCDGQQLRLPRVLPGEIVDVEDGKVISIQRPSPERVPPFCDKFATCGGCKLQHWHGTPYAFWKRAQLEAALAARSLHPAIAPLLDAHGEGRRRASLHVRTVDGMWRAGYMGEKSHRLCALEVCPVLVPELAHAPAIAADFGPVLGSCDVLVTAADNGLDVAVKAERKALPNRLAALQDIFRRRRMLRLAVNGEELMAEAAPAVRLGRSVVRLPVEPFLQATRAGENILSGLVMEGLGPCKSVADLFCGLGPFTLRLAEHMSVAAFDSDRDATAQLRDAVRRTQGLKPVTCEVRNLYRAPLTPAELNCFGGVVFDPPRAGAMAQAQMIARSRVRRVVAVSCDVQTFARDAAILVAGGYRFEKAVPVDQFKWTAHLESVGIFSR